MFGGGKYGYLVRPIGAGPLIAAAWPDTGRNYAGVRSQAAGQAPDRLQKILSFSKSYLASSSMAC
jgi:hypothetical protein